MATYLCVNCRNANAAQSAKSPDRYRRIPPCTGWAAPTIPCGYDDTGVVARALEWDRRFLLKAAFLSQWSKDPSTKAFSVIADEHRLTVTEGYNGFPRGVADTPERLADRNIKYKMVLHAEENAILFAKRDLTDCTIYVHPCPPCARCAAMIIQSGIAKVVSVVPTDDYLSRWAEEYHLATAMFAEAKVNMTLYKQEEVKL